jgi:hypothetical protein
MFAAPDEGADVRHVAKTRRARAGTIEKHGAAPLEITLEVAAINVRRAMPKTGRSAGNATA